MKVTTIKTIGELLKKTKSKGVKERKKAKADYKEILETERTIRNWHESIEANARNGGSDKTIKGVMSGFRKFILFLGSGPDEFSKLTLDELIAKCKASEQAIIPKLLITRFYSWLQGKEVTGYQATDKTVSALTAKMVSHSQARGYLTHNGVVFGKFRAPKSDISKVTKTDRAVPLIVQGGDEKWRLNDTFFAFYNKLRHRDQVVLACLVSGGGHDLQDLFKLTVGDIRDERNFMEKKQFIFRGIRNKTSERFTVFFSGSASKMVRDYARTVRKDAADSDPLFVYTESKTQEKKALKQNQVTANFYRIANELGFVNGDGEQNPFRPKRFRHIFNQLCIKNEVPREVVKIYQGHSVGVSVEYTSYGIDDLWKEYQKVSKFLDVTEVIMTKIDEEIDKIKAENKEIKEQNEDLTYRLAKMQKTLSFFMKRMLSEKDLAELTKSVDKIEVDPDTKHKHDEIKRKYAEEHK